MPIAFARRWSRVSVSPSSGLVDLQQVTLNGTGWAPGPVLVFPCGVAVTPACNISSALPPFFAFADANGNFGPIPFTIHRSFTSLSPPVPVDCATWDGGCVLVADQGTRFFGAAGDAGGGGGIAELTQDEMRPNQKSRKRPHAQYSLWVVNHPHR